MKKKILFVVQKMTVGGIASSLVNLLNLINEKYNDEYDVELFAFSGGKLLENIPKNIKVSFGTRGLRLVSTSFGEVIKSCNPVNIGMRIFLTVYAKFFGSDNLYLRFFEKCKINKKYDVAVSYFNDITTVRFSRGTNMFVSDFVDAATKIAWVHTDPVLCRFDVDHCKNIYRKFDKIMCVSEAVKKKMDSIVPEYADRTQVCYNKFNHKKIKALAGEQSTLERSVFNVVTVCRIDNTTKRTDEIVRLCRRLKDDGISGFKWTLVGAGPDLKCNMKLAKNLDVCDVVSFVGEKTNPYPYIHDADMFALYSAYEGYPMVIGEAIILGTKIITTAYAAVDEQIDEDAGMICRNDEEFYEKLKFAILNTEPVSERTKSIVKEKNNEYSNPHK